MSIENRPSKERRITARAIDFVLVFVASSVLYTAGWLIALASIGCVGAGFQSSCGDNETGAYAAAAIVVFTILMPVIYETLVSPTLGKRLLGLRVVQVDGGPASRGRRFKRALLLWVPLQAAAWGTIILPEGINGWFFLLWIAYLAYLSVTVLRRGNPPHDELAGTRVISARAPVPPQAPPPPEKAPVRRYRRQPD